MMLLLAIIIIFTIQMFVLLDIYESFKIRLIWCVQYFCIDWPGVRLIIYLFIFFRKIHNRCVYQCLLLTVSQMRHKLCCVFNISKLNFCCLLQKWTPVLSVTVTISLFCHKIDSLIVQLLLFVTVQHNGNTHPTDQCKFAFIIVPKRHIR